MSSFCLRAKRTIKNQDLFGVPVQLTYQGDKSFKTACGGCLSILFVLSFTVGFILQFRELYVNPQWVSSPETFDYSSTRMTLSPNESTFAVSFYNVVPPTSNNTLRVKYTDSTGASVAPMFCTDVYSEEIEAERNGTSSSAFFTDTFVNIDATQTPFVCPGRDVLIGNDFGLYISFVTCSNYAGLPYPGNPECDTALEQ